MPHHEMDGQQAWRHNGLTAQTGMGPPTVRLGLILAATLFAPTICNGASLLIDDFSDGSFSLIGQYGKSLDDKGIQVGTMLGGDRYTALSSSFLQFGATAELVSGTSMVSFVTDTGPSGPLDNQGTFYAAYGVPLIARDFTGYPGFELSIPAVLGTGMVEVWIRGSLSNYQAAFTVPIDHAGSIFIPIDGPDAVPELLSSVNDVRLTFTALTSDFSVSVERFSVVPEPAPAVLVALGVGLAFRRNPRSEQAAPVPHEKPFGF